jgi:hypothetical protein
MASVPGGSGSMTLWFRVNAKLCCSRSASCPLCLTFFATASALAGQRLRARAVYAPRLSVSVRAGVPPLRPSRSAELRIDPLGDSCGLEADPHFTFKVIERVANILNFPLHPRYIRLLVLGWEFRVH